MITTPQSNSLARYTEPLEKFGQQLAGITLLCYLTGFVITNLYLGSLGIVNLEILRARYILSGILFLLFLSAIGYLICGLFQTLRRHRQLSPLSLIWKVAWFSLQNIALLYLSVPAIAVLVGLPSSPHVGIPQLSPNVSWSNWFANAPVDILKHSVKLYAGFLIILALVFIIIIVVMFIYPKDKCGVRIPRKRIVGKVFEGITQKKIRFLGSLLTVFVFLLAFKFIFDLLGFIVSNKISTSGTSSLTIFLPEGWRRYFVGILLVYALPALYLTFLFITQPSSPSEKEDTFLVRTSARIYLIALATIIIVPVYALGIYPYLPQHSVGGAAYYGLKHLFLVTS